MAHLRPWTRTSSYGFKDTHTYTHTHTLEDVISFQWADTSRNRARRKSCCTRNTHAHAVLYIIYIGEAVQVVIVEVDGTYLCVYCIIYIILNGDRQPLPVRYTGWFPSYPLPTVSPQFVFFNIMSNDECNRIYIFVTFKYICTIRYNNNVFNCLDCCKPYSIKSV